MSLLIIILLGITLSMDAFSLSLIYGTLNLSNSEEKLMSIMVGIFHFIMPLIGFCIGELILKIIKVDPDYIVGIIFLLLGIEMLLSIKKEEKIKVLVNIFSIILFAFTVSIDSFSVGITLVASNTNVFLSCFIFLVLSSLFTYIGVNLGKKLSIIYGNITTLIGAILLLILSFTYLT